MYSAKFSITIQGKSEVHSKCFYWALFLLGSFTCLVEGAPHQTKYAVVIDAGSTGTRVNAFEFSVNPSNGQLILGKEFFFPVKPGLSSYHKEPQKAAESMENLLVETRKFVPEEFRPSTPIVVKATAGLRLLLPAEAKALIDTVRNVLLKSEFIVPDNAVEIMDGVDEGIFSWFTLNTLLGRLDSVHLGKNTMATLDLGGGSTQVTFDVKDPSSVPSLNNFIHKMSTPKAQMNVFTHSYLNLGVEAVRHTVFTSGKTTDEKNYVCECMNPSIKSTEFTYGTKTYYLSGKNNSKSTQEKKVVDFDACINLVKQKILPLVNPKPLHLNDAEIAAASYFIHRSIKGGLVPESGGITTVGQYREKAKEICAQANADQPFLCLDLVYMSTLLSEGYGLSPDKKINLYRRINGRRISWALGCAYSLYVDMSHDARGN